MSWPIISDVQRCSNSLYMKPRPLPYGESLDGCIPVEAALTWVPRNMTATVAWQIKIWSTECDKLTDYQTTNE